MGKTAPVNQSLDLFSVSVFSSAFNPIFQGLCIIIFDRCPVILHEKKYDENYDVDRHHDNEIIPSGVVIGQKIDVHTKRIPWLIVREVYRERNCV